jgi:uncharacterized membrane protein YedE/YeeE
MKATNWEFTNGALLFGLIFAFSFPLYFLDHQNSTAALASWLGSRLQRDPDLVARLLFAFAAFWVLVGLGVVVFLLSTTLNERMTDVFDFATAVD